MPRLILLLLLLLGTAATAQNAPDPAVIFDMDTIRHKPGEITNKDKQKVPVGTVESVGGKFGKAVKFTFIPEARGGFMIAPARATPAWNDAAGFSFWVKGDGSQSWAGLELIDKTDFKLRYGYCFPIDSTDWTKITVPWRDLTPEIAAPLVNPAPAAQADKSAYAPANFGNLWFGKWFYYRDYPAHSFAIDHVALEPTIDRPDVPPPTAFGLKRLRAKLGAKRPITIVTMGDSLTDPRHWANRTARWPDLLAADLKAKYGSDVTIVNPAIGGTTLSQNLILMPRWLKETPQPDLVTIWFGGNDHDAGVKADRFKQYLTLAVARLREKTAGQTDILILTTAPAHARWETYADLEQAAKDVAKNTGAALADTAEALRHPGSPDKALEQKHWEWDKVHLGAKGHEITKDAVLRAITEE